MNYKFTEIEAKIFDAVKNATFNHPIKSREVESSTGIDNRILAATVRKMNERFKGDFHIGAAKDKGYWLCRTEEEAIASLISYNKTVMSMLGERKKIKEQIRVTFAANKDLFGEPVLTEEEIKAQAIRMEKKELYNPFLEH